MGFWAQMHAAVAEVWEAKVTGKVPQRYRSWLARGSRRAGGGGEDRVRQEHRCEEQRDGDGVVAYPVESHPLRPLSRSWSSAGACP